MSRVQCPKCNKIFVQTPHEEVFTDYSSGFEEKTVHQQYECPKCKCLFTVISETRYRIEIEEEEE